MTFALDHAELLTKLAQASFATFGHFIEDGFAEPAIAALLPNKKIVGFARTVRVADADATIVNRALFGLGRNDVLVLDMAGDHRHAPVGAVTGCAAQNAGARGIVVDGVVTDIQDLRAMGMPVFARGTSQLTTKRRPSLESALDVGVRCGGQTVKPGDFVLADDNGVLFLDPRVAAELIDQVLESDRREPDLIARLRAGEPAASVLASWTETGL